MRAALFVAIQGECRHRPEGVRTEKAGVGQGAKCFICSIKVGDVEIWKLKRLKSAN